MTASPAAVDEVLQRVRILPVVVTDDPASAPEFPGVATATEIQAALARGVSAVKSFPAEPLRGAATVVVLAAPFAGVRFIPTGGIGPAQAGAYLKLHAVLAVGGSWMGPATVLAPATERGSPPSLPQQLPWYRRLPRRPRPRTGRWP